MTIALVLSVTAAVVGGLFLLVKREPGFYAATAGEAGWGSREKSARLVTRVQDLKNDIRSKPEWGDTFTTADLNCFFAENMSRKGGLCSILPDGFHSPRVAVDGDRLKMGFKYREGFWSTVVWVELRVWLVDKETNLVAVEVCDLRAGGLPIGSQSVLDAITEAARDSNIEVTWYRHKSNPVGLFRFYADQAQPTSQILTLEVKDGQLTVAGRTQLEQTAAAGP
jgi:hypothetical protein